MIFTVIVKRFTCDKTLPFSERRCHSFFMNRLLPEEDPLKRPWELGNSPLTPTPFFSILASDETRREAKVAVPSQ
jgi:hypothetical protein